VYIGNLVDIVDKERITSYVTSEYKNIVIFRCLVGKNVVTILHVIEFLRNTMFFVLEEEVLYLILPASQGNRL
jgi:hypothetical protein